MTRHWGGRSWGSGLGVLIGLPLVGAAEASPDYISSPIVGLGLGAAAALAGFGLGVVWDRRAERQARRQLWLRYFAGLPDVPRARTDAESVLATLHPAGAVVPFERSVFAEIGRIRTWATGAGGARVRHVSGAAGTGKTRLAMQVCAQLGSGDAPWRCGWLLDEPGPALDLAFQWPEPVLVVVDNAESRHDLAKILTRLHARRPADAQRVRLVLLAREFGDWWLRLQTELGFEVDVAQERTVLTGATGRQRWTRVAHALPALSAAASPPVEPRRVTVGDTGSEPSFMALHATVWEGALRAAATGEPVTLGVDEAVAGLLRREQDGWLDRAAWHGLSLPVETLREAVVLTALAGIRERPAVVQRLRLVKGLEALDQEGADRLIVWLRQFEQIVGFYARPRLPAIFEEHLIVTALVANPSLAATLVAAAESPGQMRQAVAIVADASVGADCAQRAMTTLLAADGEKLIPFAVQLVLRAQSRLHLDGSVAAAIRVADLSWPTLQEINRLLPTPRSGAMLQIADAVYREGVEKVPDAVDRADWLRRHGEVLFVRGEVDSAYETVREAVRVLRSPSVEGHEKAPGALAQTLVDLGQLALVSDRPQQGLTALDDGLARWRELMKQGSGFAVRGLTLALRVKAQAFQAFNRQSEAVDVLIEAQLLLRGAGADGLPVDADDLLRGHGAPGTQQLYIDNLWMLGDSLARDGRPEQAVAMLDGAVPVLRTLPGEALNESRLEVIRLQILYGRLLDRAGRCDEAVDMLNWAIKRVRPMAEVSSQIFSVLAEGLADLSTALLNADRIGEAVIVAREAVAVRRRALRLVNSARNTGLLAEALERQATAALRAYDVATALRAAREAVPLFESALETLPSHDGVTVKFNQVKVIVSTFETVATGTTGAAPSSNSSSAAAPTSRANPSPPPTSPPPQR